MNTNDKKHNGIATIKGIATEAQFDLLRRELLEKVDLLVAKIDDPEEWLTTKGACRYLKIGTTKLHNLVTAGLIKKYKLGGGVRYNKNELREVIYNDSL